MPVDANPTYADMLAYAESALHGATVLLANADVVFSESLGLIRRDAFVPRACKLAVAEYRYRIAWR